MTDQTPPTDRPLTAGDWIDWHGGENPVPGQMVNWQTRNEPNRDDCETAVPSEVLDWSRPPRQAGNPPVIAYRLARPATSAASEVMTQACVDWDEYTDDIADVISDSLEMDWTSSDGARAVVRWLNENAPFKAQGDRK